MRRRARREASCPPKAATPTSSSPRPATTPTDSHAHQRGEPERLQKVLARAGLASRREAEEWIRAGRLTVNGQAASLGVRVSPDDEVRLDGRVIRQRAPQSGGRAYIYHRSPGESLDAAPADAPDAVPLACAPAEARRAAIHDGQPHAPYRRRPRDRVRRW